MQTSTCRLVWLLTLASTSPLASAEVVGPVIDNTEYLRQICGQSPEPPTGNVPAVSRQVVSRQVVPRQVTSSLKQPLKFASFQPIVNPLPAPRDLVLTSIGNTTDCTTCENVDSVAVFDGACNPRCEAWTHFTAIYAEGLYMRPRNAEVAYAVPINGPIAAPPASNPIQIGRVGVVDLDYEFDYALGAILAMNPLASLEAKYSTLDFSDSDSLSTSVPNVIRSLVAHPSSASAATDFLSASADLRFDYDTLDLQLRHLFVGGENFAINYLFGARYGRLDQGFSATFVNGETETVTTDIDFEGVGLRLGFDIERRACGHRRLVYMRGAANFMAGRFRASYFQGSNFDPEIVNTNWETGRVVPTLELEIGAGFRTRSERVRVTVGYRVDAWFNMVTGEDFIWAVQQNNFLALEDTISFDGLVTRVEVRF